MLLIPIYDKNTDTVLFSGEYQKSFTLPCYGLTEDGQLLKSDNGTEKPFFKTVPLRRYRILGKDGFRADYYMTGNAKLLITLSRADNLETSLREWKITVKETMIHSN